MYFGYRCIIGKDVKSSVEPPMLLRVSLGFELGPASLSAAWPPSLSSHSSHFGVTQRYVEFYYLSRLLYDHAVFSVGAFE